MESNFIVIYLDIGLEFDKMGVSTNQYDKQDYHEFLISMSSPTPVSCICFTTDMLG